MSVAAVSAELQRGLLRAADDRLSQVVALVDAMPHRGAADALIEPLRARLAVLAPSRPLSLSRLLFKPLDPAILPGARWWPGMPAVPRTALAPIGGAVLDGMGPSCIPVRALVAGHDSAEAAVVAQAGALLWPAAALVLDTLPMPAEWTDATGLPPGCYDPVRADIAAVLHQAVAIRRCGAMAEGPERAAGVRDLLADTASLRPAGLAIVLAVLLSKGLATGPALAAAGGPAVDLAGEHALDRAQHVLKAVMPNLPVAAAAAQAVQIGALLDAMEGPQARPGMRSRAREMRRAADAACRTRLLVALDRDFLPRVADPGPEMADAEVTALEGVARGLRRLALAGRRFGAGAISDSLLGGAATGLCAASSMALSRMDRLRLAELLLGPSAALQMQPGRLTARPRGP